MENIVIVKRVACGYRIVHPIPVVYTPSDLAWFRKPIKA